MHDLRQSGRCPCTEHVREVTLQLKQESLPLQLASLSLALSEPRRSYLAQICCAPLPMSLQKVYNSVHTMLIKVSTVLSIQKDIRSGYENVHNNEGVKEDGDEAGDKLCFCRHADHTRITRETPGR